MHSLEKVESFRIRILMSNSSFSPLSIPSSVEELRIQSHVGQSLMAKDLRLSEGATGESKGVSSRGFLF